MSAKPHKIFKLWVTLLSIVLAALLFPNIIDKHGVWMSIVYTAMGISVIWLAYFGIGRFINCIVNEEIKRRNLPR
jgi:hypothetical protein